jgi:hypothetical protein
VPRRRYRLLLKHFANLNSEISSIAFHGVRSGPANLDSSLSGIFA